LHQRRLSDEDQIVGSGEVLEEEPELSETVRLHEVGVINERHEHLACSVKPEGFLNEKALAFAVTAIEFDLEGFTEYPEGVVIGVKRPVDHGGNHAFWVMVNDGMFDNGFTCAGFAKNEAKSALLSMDAEDVEDLLLMRQQGQCF
jgi:hypothetical protein